jgi:cysteinyl-tRNA synthetase
MSSGAAMAIAAKVASRLNQGTIVVIFPDGGERYLSTSVFAVAEKTGPQLFNTLTRRKQAIEPTVEAKIGIYSCGPTAHAPMNLTECRRMVFADLLDRYLCFRGFEVNHVMNITDLDDKTIDGSEKAGLSVEQFTSRHIEAFHRDLAFLGAKPAAAYPKASEHIAEMVDMARQLVAKGYAYEKMRSLYFDISRASGYGRLSGIDLDKIRLGATVDLEDYEKNNPRDFTLLKRSTLKELKRGIFTKTEWGNVRPSWHLQCTAMSMKYLGQSFDIHTASRDLVFPHHENEMAIAAALTGKPLAKYWIHCEGVLVEGKKAQAAALTLADLAGNGYTGKQVRYLLLANHYRKPITLSPERLADSNRSLARINRCIHALANLTATADTHPETAQICYDIKTSFTDAMDDDLNTSAAMASLFTTVRRIHKLIQDNKLSANDAHPLLDAFAKVDEVLNVLDLQPCWLDEKVRALMGQREKARRQGDFATADGLRRQLMELGIRVMDPRH